LQWNEKDHKHTNQEQIWASKDLMPFEQQGATNIEEENIYLKLFPRSLIGWAKDWYLDQLSTTQDKLEHSRGQIHKKILPSYQNQYANITIIVSNEMLFQVVGISRGIFQNFNPLSGINSKELEEQSRVLLEDNASAQTTRIVYFTHSAGCLRMKA